MESGGSSQGSLSRRDWECTNEFKSFRDNPPPTCVPSSLCFPNTVVPSASGSVHTALFTAQLCPADMQAWGRHAAWAGARQRWQASEWILWSGKRMPHCALKEAKNAQGREQSKVLEDVTVIWELCPVVLRCVELTEEIIMYSRVRSVAIYSLWKKVKDTGFWGRVFVMEGYFGGWNWIWGRSTRLVEDL
jgi:hypothetical protein